MPPSLILTRTGDPVEARAGNCWGRVRIACGGLIFPEKCITGVALITTCLIVTSHRGVPGVSYWMLLTWTNLPMSSIVFRDETYR